MSADLSAWIVARTQPLVDAGLVVRELDQELAGLGKALLLHTAHHRVLRVFDNGVTYEEENRERSCWRFEEIEEIETLDLRELMLATAGKIPARIGIRDRSGVTWVQLPILVYSDLTAVLERAVGLAHQQEPG